MDTISTDAIETTTEILPEPAKVFRRNIDTGLVEGVEYALNQNGRIDWFQMINPDYIVFNRSPKLEETLVKNYGGTAFTLVYKDVIASGKVVDPRHILVLLSGFVELAELRGYCDCNITVNNVTPGQNVTCTCHISWLDNREDPRGKTSAGTADATPDNVGMLKMSGGTLKPFPFFAAIAENRSFVRAIRRGLAIPVLGFDELDPKDTMIPESNVQSNNSGMPLSSATLKKAAELNKTADGKSRPLSFEEIKEASITKYKKDMESDPSIWKKFEDIPPRDCLTLIKLIKTKNQGTEKS